MRALCLALSLLLGAAAAGAGGFPALYSVTGVAADDVLNIRTEPSASAPLIGWFSPDETDIEVTATDSSGSWGQVNAGEASGWTSLRYLQRQAQEDWRSLSTPLSCFGTEPFWSLSLGAPVIWSEAGAEKLRLTMLQRAESRGHPGKSGFTAVSQGQPAANFTGVLTAQTCSDGMSDTAYGIALDLLIAREGQAEVFSGCCSLSD